MVGDAWKFWFFRGFKWCGGESFMISLTLGLKVSKIEFKELELSLQVLSKVIELMEHGVTSFQVTKYETWYYDI